MRSQIRSVPMEGAELAVETCGHGKPVVLVHGFADDRSSWSVLSAGLVTAHEVIRYDLRGYGQSKEFGNIPFRHSNDLLHVLDAMCVDVCDVIGVSMGGSVCLNFALEHPNRVRRLVLLSPGIVGWEWSEQWKALWAKIVDAAHHDMEKARQLWFDHPLFASTRHNVRASDALKNSIGTYSGRHWIEDNEQPAYPDVDRLTELTIPTLLLTGEHDLPEFLLIADLIDAAAQNVRRTEIKNAGHMLHLEKPEEIAVRILEYLAS